MTEAKPSHVDRSWEYSPDLQRRRLEEENARLRAALTQYADRERWQALAVPLANGNVRLWAAFDDGWGVAEAALERKE